MRITSYRPRVYAEVSQETFDEIGKLPHGLRGKLLTMIIEDVVEAFKEDRKGFIARLISREMAGREVLKFQEL